VSNFEITEKWLMEAGGWQVMKRARMLVDQGRVLDVTYDGKLLKGTVGDDKRNLPSGMLIRGRTDVENLCNCPEARRSGILCQHAMALGVALARGQQGAGGVPVENKSTKPAQKKSAKPEVAFQAPVNALSFHFAKNAAQGFGRGSISVRVGDTGSEAGFENDLPVLAWLQKLSQTSVPPQLMLQKADLSGFFNALQGHPRIFVGDDPLRIDPMPLRLPLVLESVGEERVALRLEIPKDVAIAISEESVWGYLIERHYILRVPRTPDLPKADQESLFATAQPPHRPFERTWRWFFQHAETLENAFRLDSSALPKMPSLLPARPTFQFELEGSLNHLAGVLTCHYRDDLKVKIGENSESFPFALPGKPWELFSRNLNAESEALARLTAAGFSEPNKQGEHVLKGEQGTLRFFASTLPRLQRDWTVTLGERFAHVTRDIARITPEIKTVPHADGGWLDVDIGYSSEQDHSLPRHEIQRLLQVGQSHTRLKNGTRVVVDLEACEELNAVLQDIEPDQDHGRYRIAASQEDYLNETLGEFANREVEDIPQAPFPEEALADLASILRDYQREGVCWMLGRTERGLSGILADEMGLGKTLQSLSVIQALHIANKDEHRQSLVVCPTSLLDNWCAEAARFTPDLRTLKIHGAQRERLWKKADKHDLLVTSYGMLVRDLEQFQAQNLLGVFLDEASAIKNHSTKSAKAACALGGQFRFALTGTPIENSVRDLWSIMQYVAPGYLGSKQTFKERYEQPLASEAGPSREVQDRLRRRLRPFILRRTKRRVATELPERLEKVLTCPLTQKQRNTYTSLLRAGREKVLEARDQGEGVARMTMLTTLLRLRQVCCDLRLLGATEPESKEKTSGKLETIRELLQEAQEGQHRVLIFSQFVSMLHLLRDELEATDTGFCYLDGQTRHRQDEVDRFQKGDVPIFLISLKAGGYGLNLTAADTVIHFDPWWNPAVEAQATDRAHRIGQQNVVTSYKLISEDTVEEKILRLQRRKRQVIDAALDDEQPLMQGLTTNDLEDVLDL
jgi:superfamily II DNA or RNA helicase